MGDAPIRKEVDVCVVGLGGTGAMLAHVLAARGRDVVALEAGPMRGPDAFVMDEIMSTAVRNAWGEPKFNHEVPTWRPDAKSAARRAPGNSYLANGVGGSTVPYGATSHRFHPDDFAVRTNTVARYGASVLPEGSEVTDWPLSYNDLEPYYDLAERLLGVSGQAGNLQGVRAPGGNPFEGARHRDFPRPPLRPFALGRMFAESASRLGYHPFPIPVAILSEPYHGRQACTYCSYCHLSCHVGAKGSVLATVIRPALDTGRLEIRAGCRVLSLAVDDRGGVFGVEYLGPEGRTIQPAGTVVLAGYTFENVRLLLLSRSRHYPQGVGNGSGQVGRYFMARQQPFVWGVFEGHRLNRFTGPGGQGHAIDDFNADNFDHTGLGFIRGAKLWVNNGFLPIANSSRVLPPGTPRWGRRYKEFICEHGNSLGELRIMPEILPYADNYIDLDPETTDNLGVPVVRITFDIHENENRMMGFFQDRAEELLDQMGATRIWRTGFFQGVHNGHEFGGARMGEDPAVSVVDGFGSVHEAKNVYVLGGAILPTMPGLNPTLTLQALALRTAAHIAGVETENLASELVEA